MLRIYLADLVYDTVKSNYVVPLNAGYLAAYLSEQLGDAADIRIFKYPKELEAAVRETPPDVLGLSHYSWNARLDRLFMEAAKERNPGVVTVMGGPNVRVEPEEVERFLRGFPALDHYVMFEGEGPLLDLARALLAGEKRPVVEGCATIKDGEFIYPEVDQMKKHREIDYPSPYLTGWLDPFLRDPEMIPLLESNRGCPFGCAYCTWGIAALSKVRRRSLDTVFAELDYVAEHSAGQVSWIFCDANFGILPRDLDIARRIREIKDARGFPVNVTVWQSKNTGLRNAEISEIIGGASRGYIAVQSTDPMVLEHIGRGNINMRDMRDNLAYYRSRGLPVLTDLLIGLPGETRQSHLNSILDAFDMGFDVIQPYNIRLLPGSKYESAASRERFRVLTKFRPIFGAYGEYWGRRVFEVEESVRATSAMTEDELDGFKILHWLLYFCWTAGIGRFPLALARSRGLNPGLVLDELSRSAHPVLRETFRGMLERSRAEWFDTAEVMVEHYDKPENFDKLVSEFTKLNSLYMAMVFRDQKVIGVLMAEMARIVGEHLERAGLDEGRVLDDLAMVTDLALCKDLLEGESRTEVSCCGPAAAVALDDASLAGRDRVRLVVRRTPEAVALCEHNLRPGGNEDLSLLNLTRFMEIGGMRTLMNQVVLAGADAAAVAGKSEGVSA